MSLLPQLRYLLSTQPFPLTASAPGASPTTCDLNLVVTNPNPGVPVAVSFIAVQIPVGSAAADLTTDASLATTPATGWTVKTGTTTGAWQATFSAPADTKIGNDALTFVIQQVPVNTEPGTVQVSCIEGSQGCAGTSCPRVPKQLTKFPQGWGAVKFSVDPAEAQAPANPTLSWSGPDQATYTIDYVGPQNTVVKVPASGEPALANSGKYPASGESGLGLMQTTVFTLNVSQTVSGTAYSAEQQLTVTVIADPAIVSFTATQLQPAADPASGQLAAVVELTWALDNADRFELTEQVGNAEPETLGVPTGSTRYKVYPRYATTTYSLTAYNGAQSSGAKTVTLSITSPIPIGTVCPFFGTGDIPSGWLLCDGGSFDQNKYPLLEPALKQSAVPDLRGYFVRGIDPSGKVDPDKARAPGNVQADALQDHAHDYQYSPESGDGYEAGSHRKISWLATQASSGAVATGQTGTPRTAAETRPKNVAANYIIYAGPPQS